MSRAPRRLPATNHWKNTVNRHFPTFSCICIFFLLTLSLPWSSLFFSPSLTVPTSAFPFVHIVGSLTSKLPSVIMIIMSIEHRVTGALTSIIIKPKPDRSMTSRTKSRKHLLQSGTIVHPPLQIIPQETKWERPPQMWMGLYGSAISNTMQYLYLMNARDEHPSPSAILTLGPLECS